MQRRTFLTQTAATAATAMAARIAWGSDHHDQTVVRYPDLAIETVDPRFEKYRQGNAAVERLWTGARWAEGPVWFGDGRFLLFSDIPNNRILCWTEETGEVSVFRTPSNYANGHTRDKQGRLTSCEHDSRRVTRTEPDGTITVLIDHFQGKRLNAPNDVVVHSNGTIWFTDPGYGIMSDYEGHKAAFELPTAVYRIDAQNGEVSVVSIELAKPNGLCFSPDEKRLYIVDTGQPPGKPHPIHVFDVVDGKRLANGRIFCDMGTGREVDRKDSLTGGLCQSLLWRRQAQSAVYGCQPVALLTLREHAGGAGAVRNHGHAMACPYL